MRYSGNLGREWRAGRLHYRTVLPKMFRCLRKGKNKTLLGAKGMLHQWHARASLQQSKGRNVFRCSPDSIYLEMETINNAGNELVI